HPPKWTGYQLLALIFGTLLSSQGTDASFVLTLAGFPPGFRSVLAFPTLSDSFVSDFLGAFQVFAFAFPFPAVPTLSVVFRLPDHSPYYRKGIRKKGWVQDRY
ncbi:hypothetical protein, partial [Streptomyces sp. NPDC059552]|uniref:hypothetical protein n=1 Tax=Streptomyces sp. NPDC059552 TaxID=3346862 RepID=UPI0036B9ABA0